MCEEHQAAGAVDPVGPAPAAEADHARVKERLGFCRNIFCPAATVDLVVARIDDLEQQVATLTQQRDGAATYYQKILAEAAERVGTAERQVATLTKQLRSTVEQCAKTVDFHRDMAERLVEDRDIQKHKAREAEAQVATLTTENTHLSAEVDRMTEARMVLGNDLQKKIVTLTEALERARYALRVASRDFQQLARDGASADRGQLRSAAMSFADSAEQSLYEVAAIAAVRGER
jgi:chromosome segregation ATPase